MQCEPSICQVFLIHLFNSSLLNIYYGLSTILEAEERKMNEVLSLVEERDVSRHILEEPSLC